jgi:putative flippase GtrA
MQRLVASRTVAQVRLASVTSVLPQRVRSLVPEVSAFAVIGAANSVLYFVIFNLTMTMGAVKATLLANGITTVLAYLAHRYWTYKDSPKTQVRREAVLFVGFNLAGTFIQSGVVAAAKYGGGLSETTDRLALNVATMVGIGLGMVFRFWAYRTLVFRPHPADHAPPTTAVEALAEAYEAEAEFQQITAPLEVELKVKQRTSVDERAATRRQ